MKAVKLKHPASVGHLAKLVVAENGLGEDDFLAAVKDLASEGALSLRRPSYELQSGWDYLFTISLSGWLWGTTGLALLSAASAALIPDLFPISAVRWVLGSIGVLYLPGYAMLQLLFPRGRELGRFVNFALGIGLSLVLVSMIGLVLNYLPWSLTLAPVVASLAGFTILVALGAAVRKYLDLTSERE